MKRLLKYTLCLVLSFIILGLNSKVEAACSYKDQAALNKQATNVQTSYEFIDEDPLNYHFRITITNITEDLRVNITDDYSIKELDITRNDTTDGIYTFDTYIASRPVTFEIEIYANGQCDDQKLLGTKLVTPMYNTYSTSYICDQVPDFEYCGQFTDTSSMTYSEFLEKAKDYSNSLANDQNENGKFSMLQFIKKYWLYFVVGIVIICLGVGIFIFIKKKNLKKKGV